MRPFFVIRQVFADPIDHHHNESAIIHIQPVRAADELIGAVSCEWAINILAQVWLVESSHWPATHIFSFLQFKGFVFNLTQATNKSNLVTEFIVVNIWRYRRA
jgi:hypothetical protein